MCEPLYIITYEDLLMLYGKAMRVTRPEDYVRDEDGLRSNLGRVYQSVFGKDAYPTLHEKAAAFLHAFGTTQHFADGNKRAAVTTMLTFIKMNGYNLDPAAINILDDVVVDLANGVRTQESVAFWLKIVIDPA